MWGALKFGKRGKARSESEIDLAMSHDLLQRFVYMTGVTEFFDRDLHNRQLERLRQDATRFLSKSERAR